MSRFSLRLSASITTSICTRKAKLVGTARTLLAATLAYMAQKQMVISLRNFNA
jgi:hypothetical protein